MATALTQHLGAWWAHPGHGSRLAELMRGTPEADPAAALEQAAGAALAPLERARRIRDLRIRVTVADAGARATILATAHDIARGAVAQTEVTLP
jgi:hypothetical protein